MAFGVGGGQGINLRMAKVKIIEETTSAALQTAVNDFTKGLSKATTERGDVLLDIEFRVLSASVWVAFITYVGASTP